MRLPSIIALAAATATLLTAASADAARKTPQEQLAKALEGRTPGTPVDCIYQQQIQSSQVIDKTAILYRIGSTIYVNTPRSGKEFLDSSDILVTDTHSPQLCSIDIVRLIDQSSRMPSGSLGLDKFVPYTKPKG